MRLTFFLHISIIIRNIRLSNLKKNFIRDLDKHGIHYFKLKTLVDV